MPTNSYIIFSHLSPCLRISVAKVSFSSACQKASQLGRFAVLITLSFFNFFEVHCLGFRRRFIKIALDGVEDSVDELRGLVRGKSAGDFEGLIYRYGARRGLVQELVNSETQDVAIHQRHARDAPVFGARANSFVDLWQIFQRAQRQSGRELVRARFQFAISQFRPEGAREIVSARSRNVSRKEHLQGALARLTTRTHKISDE